jgi:hypothetical protein
MRTKDRHLGRRCRSFRVSRDAQVGRGACSDAERRRVSDRAARSLGPWVECERHKRFVRHFDARVDAKPGGRYESEASVVVGVTEDDHEVLAERAGGIETGSDRRRAGPGPLHARQHSAGSQRQLI